MNIRRENSKDTSIKDLFKLIRRKREIATQEALLDIIREDVQLILNIDPYNTQLHCNLHPQHFRFHLLK